MLAEKGLPCDLHVVSFTSEGRIFLRRFCSLGIRVYDIFCIKWLSTLQCSVFLKTSIFVYELVAGWLALCISRTVSYLVCFCDYDFVSAL